MRGEQSITKGISMQNPSKVFESIYANRRKKLLRNIRDEAALFPASPRVITNSCEQPYRQNSDFYYLTGFSEPQSALLLLGSSRGPRSVLYVREKDALREQWQGEMCGVKKAKRIFRVDETRDVEQLKNDLPQFLSDKRVLHYAAGVDPQIDSLVWDLFRSGYGPRLNFPEAIKDSRILTSEMRITKDRQEIARIRHVVDITAHGFLRLAPRLKTVSSEAHAAKLLESFFVELGAHDMGFPTIVAAGKHAVVLHHSPTLQPLWKRELVLVDAGASFGGYAGDITRTFPVSGKFSGPQAQLYDIVLEARRQALAAAKPNSTLEDMHRAAVRAITKGLCELGLMQGSLSQLLTEEAYKRFYMHRTGHWLGLDVHDIAPIYSRGRRISAYERPLEAGNVLTVEPGLYISPKEDSVPKEFRGIGIRIEEDVLITPSGCSILSARMPVSRPDIEALME